MLQYQNKYQHQAQRHARLLTVSPSRLQPTQTHQRSTVDSVSCALSSSCKEQGASLPQTRSCTLYYCVLSGCSWLLGCSCTGAISGRSFLFLLLKSLIDLQVGSVLYDCRCFTELNLLSTTEQSSGFELKIETEISTTKMPPGLLSALNFKMACPIQTIQMQRQSAECRVYAISKRAVSRLESRC